jgi:hypothetical protein
MSRQTRDRRLAIPSKASFDVRFLPPRLSELHQLRRIEKRVGNTLYITKRRVKDQNWLANCLANESLYRPLVTIPS